MEKITRQKLQLKGSLSFMITDWHGFNANSDEFPFEDKDKRRRFLVKLFGVSKEGYSIALTVKGYKPYFYIRVPEGIKNTSILEQELRKINGNISNITVEKKYRFRWFNGYKTYKFLKIEFINSYAYKKMASVLNQGIIIDKKPYKIEQYGSNVEPIIKFMHDAKLKGCSWVKIPKNRYDYPDEELSNTQIDIICDFSELIPLDKTGIAPLLMNSWDIEADSSHGDFPLAIKDYTKPAGELLEIYTNLINTKSIPEDTELKQLIKTLLYNGFNLKVKEKIEINYKLSKIYAVEKPSLEKINILIPAIIKIMKKCEFAYDKETGKISSFTNRKYMISALRRTMDNYLPRIYGDRCIQIGNVLKRFGSNETTNVVFTLDETADIPNGIVKWYNTEKELLLAWQEFILETDPDVMIGYNTFGFDYEFLYTRAKELGIIDKFMNLGRNHNENSLYTEKKLSSSALGDNKLKLIEMTGRINVDLYKVFQGDPTNKLDSYKLDYVSEKFLKQNKDDVSPQEIFKYQKGTPEDRAIIAKYCIQDCILVMKLMDKKKIIVNNIGMANVCLVPLSYLFMRGQGVKIYSLVADECNRNDYLIPLTRKENNYTEKKKNELENGDLIDIEIAGEIYLIEKKKLDILKKKYTNEEEFDENVIKYSISSEEEDIELNDTTEEDEEKQQTQDDSYEGAIVLDPQPSIYLDDPTTVCDYNSLYPSSMIERNISHDALVSIRVYDENDVMISEEGELKVEKDLLEGKYENHTYIDVKYDNYTYRPAYNAQGKLKKNPEKVKNGYIICRYVQFPDGKKGILPRILQKLLKARKDTRLRIEFKTVLKKNGEKITGLLAGKTENTTKIKCITFGEINTDTIVEIANVDKLTDTYDDFEKAVLDSLQLAYKVVANSLYGQVGASTSPICWKVLAASTTATGRDRLYVAKNHIEENYQCKEIALVWDLEYYKKELFRNKNMDLSKYEIRNILVKNGRIVYGDTDSIFSQVDIFLDGRKIIREEAIPYHMRLYSIWSYEISCKLGKPQNLGMEKTIYPMILIGKKQYTGIYYENIGDINDNHEKSMGIAPKKRNYAQIVGTIFYAIRDYIIENKDIEGSKQILSDCLEKLMNGEYPMEQFVITKTLKDRIAYSNPDGVAHRVLADRMGERGIKTQSNDRIPYCYVKTPPQDKKVKLKQGDMIEHPDYIKEKKLEVDYKFYLTNQIMNPICQIYGLVMDKPEKLFEKYIPLKLSREEKKVLKEQHQKELEEGGIKLKPKKKLLKEQQEQIVDVIKIFNNLQNKLTMKNKLEEIQSYAESKGINICKENGKKKTKAELISDI